MGVKEVKLNTDYKYNDQIVFVTKRVKNSYKEKWNIGFGNKYQKINHRRETTFLLNIGEEVYAKDLKLI